VRWVASEFQFDGLVRRKQMHVGRISQCDTRAVQWPRSLLIAGGGDQDTDTAAAVDAAARLWCAHVIRT